MIVPHPAQRGGSAKSSAQRAPARRAVLAHAITISCLSRLTAHRTSGAMPDLFDLVIAIGTLDTVNDWPRALRLVRHSMRNDGPFIGALSGGNTLPRLRAAMRAADAVAGSAAPHVHPRIEPAAVAPLLEHAGF